MVVYTKLVGGEFFFDDELEGCQMRLRFARDMQKADHKNKPKASLPTGFCLRIWGSFFGSAYCQVSANTVNLNPNP